MPSGSSPTSSVTGQPVQAVQALPNPEEEPPALVALAEEVEVPVLLAVVVRLVLLVVVAPLELPVAVPLLVEPLLTMSAALLLPPELVVATEVL